MMLLLLAVLAVTQSTDKAQPPRIGVAAATSNVHCLSLPGERLARDTPITLIAIGEHQRVSRAVVWGTADICGIMSSHEMPGPYYLLGPEEKSVSLPELAVAVVGRPEALAVGGRVRFRLSERMPEAQVRSCASSEGLHLTVWSGTPLKSRRLWHAYWYLGLDVEQNFLGAEKYAK